MVAISSSSTSSSYLAYLLQQANSTSATNAYTTTSSSSSKTQSASDMFTKLSDEVGGDGKTVTKTQLENYISSLESDSSSSSDKGKLGFLKQLDENWDKISNGSDSITESDMASGMSYLAPPTKTTSSGSSSSSTNDLYQSLVDAMGTSSSSGISEEDLLSYLGNLMIDNSSSDSDSSTTSSDSDSTSSDSTKTSSTSSTASTKNAKEAKLVLSLLNNFGTFADSSTGTITSSSFYSAFYEPQDTSTISSDQLTSPIDLRV